MATFSVCESPLDLADSLHKKMDDNNIISNVIFKLKC